MFAHNWAFDGPVLDAFRVLPEMGWELSGVVIEAPPTILTWRKGDRVIEMLDTLNWWRMPLAKLGDAIGVPKLAMPPKTAPRSAWDRYCRNDVEVIRRTLHSWWDFLKRYDLGGFAKTLAGQAMRAYRHRFMDHPILIDNHEHATALARASYHGGRTECFKLGRVEGPVHVLDVTSMYPAVMLDNPMPTVLRLYTRSATLAELTRYVQSRAVVASVDIHTPTPQFAHAIGDKLVFPIGRIRATLTTPDLKVALQQRLIHRIHEVAVYDSARIFTRFVQEIFQLRQEATERGDDVARFLLKILMNSLYGKFAQRGTVWNTVGKAPDLGVGSWVEYDVETDTRTSYRKFAGVLQRLSRDAEAYASHPAIASHVTAYARRKLWDLMVKAGRRSVYYCDTDSLWTDDLGYSRVACEVNESTLGSLKLEATHSWVVFHGPKDYRTPEGFKVKGVRANARWLASNRVSQEQWSSLCGLVRTGRMSAPLTRLVTKDLSRTYNKGDVGSRGIVSPLSLREW